MHDLAVYGQGWKHPSVQQILLDVLLAVWSISQGRLRTLSSTWGPINLSATSHRWILELKKTPLREICCPTCAMRELQQTPKPWWLSWIWTQVLQWPFFLLPDGTSHKGRSSKRETSTIQKSIANKKSKESVLIFADQDSASTLGVRGGGHRVTGPRRYLGCKSTEQSLNSKNSWNFRWKVSPGP